MKTATLSFHGAPSQFSWVCMSQIEHTARSAGYQTLKKHEIPDGTVSSPDILVTFEGVSARSAVYILAPDLRAENIGNKDILALAEKYQKSALPNPSFTRWLSATVCLDKTKKILWNMPQKVRFPVLGDFSIDYSGELCLPDPALGIYVSPLQPGRRAYWDASLFSIDSVVDSRTAASEWIDLTGRVKTLADSPHMSLARGVWEVEWLVELDPENGVLEIHFGWGNQSHNISCATPGVYTLKQVADLEAPMAVHARVTTTRPHFQGRGRLRGAIVTYKGALETAASLPST